nr:hypothetical protein [Tanacetum cinerariifolium]
TDRLQDSLQRENDDFLRNIDENMKKVLNELVQDQVKEQVSRRTLRWTKPGGPNDKKKEVSRHQLALPLKKHPRVQADLKQGLNLDNSLPPRKPPSPDRAWNTALPATQGNAQSWISDLAKQSDARSSFNELFDTPIDFSNFIMHRLNVDTLTPDLLVGLTYELMRGSCSSLTELEYHLEEVYK